VTAQVSVNAFACTTPRREGLRDAVSLKRQRDDESRRRESVRRRPLGVTATLEYETPLNDRLGDGEEDAAVHGPFLGLTPAL